MAAPYESTRTTESSSLCQTCVVNLSLGTRQSLAPPASRALWAIGLAAFLLLTSPGCSSGARAKSVTHGAGTTGAPQPVGAAVLGAPPAAFVYSLGVPNPFAAQHETVDNGSVAFVEQCSGVARGPGAEQYRVTFLDGKAVSMLRTVCSKAPNLTFSQAKQEVQQFLPPDAGSATSFSAPPTTNPDYTPPPNNGQGEMYADRVAGLGTAPNRL